MENNFSQLNQKSHRAILIFRYSINIRVIVCAGFWLAHIGLMSRLLDQSDCRTRDDVAPPRENVFAHVFVLSLAFQECIIIFIERMAYEGVVQFVPSSHLKPKKNIWVFSATLHYWDCKISLLNDKNQGVYRRVYEFWCAFVLVVNMTTQHTTQHNTT